MLLQCLPPSLLQFDSSSRINPGTERSGWKTAAWPLHQLPECMLIFGSERNIEMQTLLLTFLARTLVRSLAKVNRSLLFDVCISKLLRLNDIKIISALQPIRQIGCSDNLGKSYIFTKWLGYLKFYHTNPANTGHELSRAHILHMHIPKDILYTPPLVYTRVTTLSVKGLPSRSLLQSPQRLCPLTPILEYTTTNPLHTGHHTRRNLDPHRSRGDSLHPAIPAYPALGQNAPISSRQPQQLSPIHR